MLYAMFMDFKEAFSSVTLFFSFNTNGKFGLLTEEIIKIVNSEF